MSANRQLVALISMLFSCSLATDSNTREMNWLMPRFPPSLPPITDLVGGTTVHDLWSFTNRVIGHTLRPWLRRFLRHLASCLQLLPTSHFAPYQCPFRDLFISAWSSRVILLSLSVCFSPASRFCCLVRTQNLHKTSRISQLRRFWCLCFRHFFRCCC